MPPKLLRQHPRAKRRCWRSRIYDPTGQLLGDGTNSYTFDANGNRNNTGYSTNTGNELASDGTWNYTHSSFAATKKWEDNSMMLWMAA